MSKVKYDSVLVPTDFSDQAHSAVDEAFALVSEPTRLTVLHVAPPLSSFAVGDPAVAWQTTSDEQRVEQLSQAFTEQFNERRYAGIRFEVAFGSPAEEITRYAEENGSDLIVLPSHGRTGLMRMMIGSVAERVVRLAHCPVLVLRN